MGYDLHITRAKFWSENEDCKITPEEWLAIAAQDPELGLERKNGPYSTNWSGKSVLSEPWLNWSAGNIYTKNPDWALINKMVEIANRLGAVVQSDDGEIYPGGDKAPYFPKPSLHERLLSWFRQLAPRAEKPFSEVKPPFKVGDRVRDAFRREAVVIEIDPKAEHGLGKVSVRYDDGRILSWMLIAAHLEPVQNDKEKNT